MVHMCDKRNLDVVLIIPLLLAQVTAKLDVYRRRVRLLCLDHRPQY